MGWYFSTFILHMHVFVFFFSPEYFVMGEKEFVPFVSFDEQSLLFNEAAIPAGEMMSASCAGGVSVSLPSTAPPWLSVCPLPIL